MSKEELLKKAKPILFNREMVQAILSGRKTVTRRVVKPRSRNACGFYVCYRKSDGVFTGVYDYDENEKMFENPQSPIYKKDDILYVREAFAQMNCAQCDIDRECETNIDRSIPPEFTPKCDNGVYVYRATDSVNCSVKWKPSIHMPKSAARIFLHVTDVRVERLQAITDIGATAEGISEYFIGMGESGFSVKADSNSFYDNATSAFISLWNGTVPKKDYELYGWNANPWVWVIEFERIQE